MRHLSGDKPHWLVALRNKAEGQALHTPAAAPDLFGGDVVLHFLDSHRPQIGSSDEARPMTAKARMLTWPPGSRERLHASGDSIVGPSVDLLKCLFQ